MQSPGQIFDYPRRATEASDHLKQELRVPDMSDDIPRAFERVWLLLRHMPSLEIGVSSCQSSRGGVSPGGEEGSRSGPWGHEGYVFTRPPAFLITTSAI
jgi:hypothetical protein